MQLTFDDEARAIYVQVRDGTVSRTLEDGAGVNVDLDANGLLLGVEVLALGQLRRVPAVLAARGAPAPSIDFAALERAFGAA